MKCVYTFVIFIHILIVCFIITPCLSVSAQIIQEISVQGNALIPESTIIARIESQVGAMYDRVLIEKDVQHIYDIGFFSDVEIEAREINAGMYLTFIVEERPVISQIEFDGNDKVKDDKIEEVLTLTLSDLSDSFNLKFYPQKIKNDIENIKQLYHEEGYHNAQVSSEVLPDPAAPDEKVILRYVIDERQKAKVQGVIFEGNTVFSEKELRENMATREQGFLSFLTGAGKYEETTFETDLERLKFFYADNGYIDATVIDYKLDFRDDTSDLFITIKLDEGEIYTIGTVSVSGHEIYSTADIEDMINVSPGDPFSRSNIRKDILAISAIYAQKGYLTPISEKTEGKLLIDPQVEIDRDKKQVNLNYIIREGVPHHLSRITIIGNEKTRDKVIRRELKIQEGQLMDTSRLERSQRDIFNLALFDDVKFNLTDGMGPNMVDLEIEVIERSTGSFNLGGGWSSVDNFVISGGFSYANLFGLAHQITLTANLSTVSQLYNIRYLMPRFLDSYYRVTLDTYKTQREYTTYDSESIGAGAGVGRLISWDVLGSLKYEYRKVDTLNVAEDASSIIREAEGISATSSGILSFNRSTINNVLLPTKGSRTRLSGQLAGGILQGDNDFYRFVLDNNTYFPIYRDLAFRFKTEFGYAEPYGGSDTIPIYERFFAGGADTIRGYEERSVGPQDENGEEIGGNRLGVISGEFIIPVRKEIRLVAFYDMGDVYGAWESFDLSTFRKSVGVGVRLFTPLGLIRLDWGYKLDREPGESPDEFHFGMGALF